MEERLALESLIERQPGVVEYAVERDWRGAVIQLRATVIDEGAKARVREIVARAIGRHFADERLQLNMPPEDTADFRVRLVEVATIVTRASTTVSVSLEGNGSTILDSAEGPPRSGEAIRLAALGTLKALQKIDPNLAADLCRVELMKMENGSVVLAEVAKRIGSAITHIYGTAPVEFVNHEIASARAVLDAMNRFLGSHSR